MPDGTEPQIFILDDMVEAMVTTEEQRELLRQWWNREMQQYRQRLREAAQQTPRSERPAWCTDYVRDDPPGHDDLVESASDGPGQGSVDVAALRSARIRELAELVRRVGYITGEDLVQDGSGRDDCRTTRARRLP